MPMLNKQELTAKAKEVVVVQHSATVGRKNLRLKFQAVNSTTPANQLFTTAHIETHLQQ